MKSAKMWVAAAGTVVTALSVALADNVWDVNDATQIGITLVTIIGTMYGVWKAPNDKVKDDE